MVRMSESTMRRLPPPTPEERERAWAALERIKRRHAELLAANGGELFPNSADEIAALHAERDAELP